MSSALEDLGLDPQHATADELKNKYRELAAIHHPDRGGQADAFARLTAMHKEAQYELKYRKCLSCTGTGVLVRARGFATTRIVCTDCGGTGNK